jgi:hypothetical protein
MARIMAQAPVQDNANSTEMLLIGTATLRAERHSRYGVQVTPIIGGMKDSSPKLMESNAT